LSLGGRHCAGGTDIVLLETVVLDPTMLRTEYVSMGCRSLVQLRHDGRKRNPHGALERDENCAWMGKSCRHGVCLDLSCKAI